MGKFPTSMIDKNDKYPCVRNNNEKSNLIRKATAVKHLFCLNFCLLILIAVTTSFCHADPLENVMVLKDLEYARYGERSMKLDLYVPEKGDGPFPMIVWVHGGGWLGGDKSDCPLLNLGYCQRGYATASVSYRFSSESPFPAQLEDVKGAIRWIRANAKEYNIDPNRIGVIGASAGGHLVSLLGVTGKTRQFDVGEHLDQSSEVQAVCNIFGPTDFLNYFQYLEEGTDLTNSLHGMVDSLLGGPLAEKMELARQASPITYADENASIFLHAHGTADLLVPFQQAEFLHDKLRQHGVSSRLILIPGAGHGDAGFFSEQLFKEIALFFDEHLPGKKRPKPGVEN